MTTSVIETQTSLAFLAKQYTSAGAFVKSLGKLLNSPAITSAYGSVGSPVSLLLPAQDLSSNPVAAGNIIKLTKQGPASQSDGSVLYTGIVDDLPDDYDPTVKHEISLLPIGSELGTAGFSRNYTAATDIAQMIRDAVANTAHCVATTGTVPNTGITGIFDFTNTTPLKVLEEAKKILGAQWTWICDEVGVVWLVNVNQASAATYTARRGVDYVSRKYTSPITNLINWVGAIGGIPAGATAQIGAVYDAGTIITGFPLGGWTHALASQYGLRALMPPLDYNRVTDQTTLNNIVSTTGQQLHRRMTKVVLKLVNYPQRINLARLAGATMRYIEPTKSPFGEPGSGVYSANLVVLDVTVDGPIQTVTLSDMPVTIDDLKYEIDRMLQDAAIGAATSISAGDPGVITPSMVYGSTGGGPNTPTLPAFTSFTVGLDNIAQTDSAYVIVAWGANPVADNVVAYELRYHKVGDSNYSYVRTADSGIKISGLIPGQAYAFALRSINNLGLRSAFTSESTATMSLDAAAPATPTGLAVIRTIRGALVSWNANTEADLQGYQLRVSIGGASSLLCFDKTLVTSYAYVAPPGTPAGTSLQFEVQAIDWAGNYSAFATWASDPSGSDMVTTADIAQAILGSSYVANPGFEDVLSNGLPAQWGIVNATGSGSSFTRNTSNAFSGAACGALTCGGSGSGFVVEIASSTFPVTAGETYYFSSWAKASVAMGGFYFRIAFGTSTPGSETNTTDIAAYASLTTAYQKFSGQVTVPAGATYCRIFLYNYQPTVASTVYVDEVYAARSIDTVMIQSAAITNAKIGALAVATAQIQDLAVTNAKVASMTIDKLLAGSLQVFGTLTTGGLQTASSGARFVIDSTSVRAYDATATDYGAGAGIRVKIGSDGSAFFAGTIAATTLLTGAIQSSTATAVPTVPGGFTGFQLDPTNGLRFFSGGTLTSQFTPTGVNVYAGTIAGATVESSTGVGSGSGGAGFQLSSAAPYLDLYSAGGTVTRWNAWTGAVWVVAATVQATYASPWSFWNLLNADGVVVARTANRSLWQPKVENARMHLSANATIGPGTPKVGMDTLDWSVLGTGDALYGWDATNKYYIMGNYAYYLVTGTVAFSAQVTATIGIYVNGTLVSWQNSCSPGSTGATFARLKFCALVKNPLGGSYIEIFVSLPSSATVVGGAGQDTFMEVIGISL